MHCKAADVFRWKGLSLDVAPRAGVCYFHRIRLSWLYIALHHLIPRSLTIEVETKWRPAQQASSGYSIGPRGLVELKINSAYFIVVIVIVTIVVK